MDLENVLLKLDPGSSFEKLSTNYVRSSSGRSYFCKITSQNGEQFRGEALSLRLISAAAPGLAPEVFYCDDIEGPQTLMISEYLNLEPLRSTCASELAIRLASLHQNGTTDRFGFAIPSYCGATRISHGWFETWDACYSHMIGELLSQLRDKDARYADLCQLGEEVRARAIPALLKELHVKPALLHGDLWCGNAGVEKGTTNPKVFDPASYYGHNEADLTIARMFGGFPESFYTTYHQKIPKCEPVDEYWERENLYEIFHYLNHTFLFGGGYASTSREKMAKALTFAKGKTV